MSDFYHHFDGMVWPAPSGEMDALEALLTYDDAKLSFGMRQKLHLIVGAYRHLIQLPRRDREDRIRKIRAGIAKKKAP